MARRIESSPEDQFEERLLDFRSFRAATERSLAHGEDRGIVLIDLGEPVDAELWPALLAAAEARTAAAIRPGDLLGRIGDGVLAILTEPEGGLEGARRVARRVGDRLDHPFTVGGRELSVHPRIGVAYRDGEADTAESMLRRAGIAAR